MKLHLVLGAVALSALVVVAGLRAADTAKPGADVKCPVSGKAVNAEKTVDFNGGKVYFCCDECPKEFKANTAKYTPKANHQLAQTGQLVEVKCPISGKDLTAGTELDVSGVKVGFCCNNCKGKVAKMSADEQITTVFTDVSKSYKNK